VYLLILFNKKKGVLLFPSVYLRVYDSLTQRFLMGGFFSRAFFSFTTVAVLPFFLTFLCHFQIVSTQQLLKMFNSLFKIFQFQNVNRMTFS